MYDRKRIARGMGAALAIWGCIGLVVASTGVAYAAPIAGVGGFNIVASEITADQLVLYPGVGDTSELSAYPQAVVELRNADLEDLTLYKTISFQRVPGLAGYARIELQNYGRVNGENVLVKASAITARETSFTGFTLDETNTNDPSTALTVGADGGARLEGAGIQAHYLAASSISLNNLALNVCYDPDADGQWERGNCITGDPVGNSIDTPQGIGEIDVQYAPDTPDSQENDDDDNISAGDVAKPIQDAVGTVVDAIGDAVDAIGDAIGSIF